MQFTQLGPDFQTLVLIQTFLPILVWKSLFSPKSLDFSIHLSFLFVCLESTIYT